LSLWHSSSSPQVPGPGAVSLRSTPLRSHHLPVPQQPQHCRSGSLSIHWQWQAPAVTVAAAGLGAPGRTRARASEPEPDSGSAPHSPLKDRDPGGPAARAATCAPAQTRRTLSGTETPRHWQPQLGPSQAGRGPPDGNRGRGSVPDSGQIGDGDGGASPSPAKSGTGTGTVPRADCRRVPSSRTLIIVGS
jgi:hypothetical protein